MPEGIKDRDADVWEALLAVADVAGAGWPERARVSAVTLVTLARERSPSLGLRLLSDIRSVFGAETISTESLLAKLHSLDESPWLDIRGKPLNDRGLAARLRHYDIKPKVVRISPTATARGYAREDFHDAWERYLPPSTSTTSVTPVTNITEPSPLGDPFESLRDGRYGLHPSDEELELPEFLDRRRVNSG
jgi:hypothetical protein